MYGPAQCAGDLEWLQRVFVTDSIPHLTTVPMVALPHTCGIAWALQGRLILPCRPRRPAGRCRLAMSTASAVAGTVFAHCLAWQRGTSHRGPATVAFSYVFVHIRRPSSSTLLGPGGDCGSICGVLYVYCRCSAQGLGVATNNRYLVWSTFHQHGILVNKVKLPFS